MAREPAVVFRFVRVEVVQHDMQLLVRVPGDHVVHEVQELAPAPPGVVPRRELPRRDIQCREQRTGAVALVLMTEAAQRRAVRQPQVALGANSGSVLMHQDRRRRK